MGASPSIPATATRMRKWPKIAAKTEHSIPDDKEPYSREKKKTEAGTVPVAVRCYADLYERGRQGAEFGACFSFGGMVKAAESVR